MTTVPNRQLQFAAIGTTWRLSVADALSDAAWRELQAQVNTRIEVFDQTYSRFRADSWIATMATEAGKYELPTDGFQLLQFYEQLYQATNGKVTPLIGQVMVDAGYDVNYSLQPKKLQAAPRWEDVLSYDETSLTLKQPALLDFGAAGKGYLVDSIGELLQQAGLKEFTIDASGDILHRSAAAVALKVGLENPRDTSEAVGVVALQNASLCASAGSRRQWKNFTHIIDPDVLASPRQILATWVIAADTMTADGLATALFFCRPKELLTVFDEKDFAWAILDADMQLEQSSNFAAQVFTAGS